MKEVNLKRLNTIILTICHSEKGKTGDSKKKKKISGSQQLAVGRGHVIVRAYKTWGGHLCNTIMLDIYHYIFVQTPRTDNIKNEL